MTCGQYSGVSKNKIQQFSKQNVQSYLTFHTIHSVGCQWHQISVLASEKKDMKSVENAFDVYIKLKIFDCQIYNSSSLHTLPEKKQSR